MRLTRDAATVKVWAGSSPITSPQRRVSSVRQEWATQSPPKGMWLELLPRKWLKSGFRIKPVWVASTKPPNPMVQRGRSYPVIESFPLFFFLQMFLQTINSFPTKTLFNFSTFLLTMGEKMLIHARSPAVETLALQHLLASSGYCYFPLEDVFLPVRLCKYCSLAHASF